MEQQRLCRKGHCPNRRSYGYVLSCGVCKCWAEEDFQGPCMVVICSNTFKMGAGVGGAIEVQEQGDAAPLA
eukprot:1161850-Pelagomonas_calceolata.AAC.11